MINQRRAYLALEKLAQQGRVNRNQIKMLYQSILDHLSYADLMLEELGSEIGALYLLEERAQHIVLEDADVDFHQLSVPEVLLYENDEPWHQLAGGYSHLPGEEKFQSETAEPWHISLRDQFTPNPVVSRFFRVHPEYYLLAEQVWRMMHKISGRRIRG